MILPSLDPPRAKRPAPRPVLCALDRHLGPFESIPELGSFLAEHARAIGPSGPASEAQRKDAIEALRSRFIEIDAAALADGDHWWATVVEQLRDGLF